MITRHWLTNHKQQRAVNEVYFGNMISEVSITKENATTWDDVSTWPFWEQLALEIRRISKAKEPHFPFTN